MTNGLGNLNAALKVLKLGQQLASGSWLNSICNRSLYPKTVTNINNLLKGGAKPITSCQLPVANC
jgi:hypothetical protein